MTSTIARPARPARRFALTLAAAGIAALGSVAIAPAASAAPVQDAPSYVIHRPVHGGPDAFIVKDKGRVVVFFCDKNRPGKHANKCIEADGARF